MLKDFADLPPAAWARITRWTAFAILASVAISVAVAQAIMEQLADGLSVAGLATSIVLPIVLGGPVMFYHVLRLQQLRLANEKLQVLASTDWLTTCLNRRAFTHQVMAHLIDPEVKGALLVIDVDHFKTINDRFGHDRGDEVLQLMAEMIRGNVRDGDLVGRIGGEEFGVFVRDATLAAAHLVAERVRHAIAAEGFAPEGKRHPLSVSVGGAFFEGRISFSELFRIADQRLYSAKQMGRNRVDVAHVSDHPPLRIGSEDLEIAAA